MTGTEFCALFGEPPQVAASAPGRVNLLGEHTDYNDGFVLPIATPQRTYAELALSRQPCCQFASAQWEGLARYWLGDPAPPGFPGYVAGCLEVLRKATGAALAPVNLLVNSEVPMGAGLSSSAALEVAVLRGLCALFRLDLDDVAIARLAQQAEVRYAGVRCGIMDQMAASLADERHMLFLDTRSLERRLLPLPEGTELVVLDSGVPRRLAEGAYNQRRAECEAAARQLGVAALREVADVGAVERLPEPLNRRARHVVAENLRVLRAATDVAAEEFGALMNASHASLRDDFEVSIAALDDLVALLQAHPAVFGARLTGAGFGGACVALARQGQGREAGSQVLAAYAGQGHQGRALI